LGRPNLIAFVTKIWMIGAALSDYLSMGCFEGFFDVGLIRLRPLVRSHQFEVFADAICRIITVQVLLFHRFLECCLRS
jgi:hypothetical protein